jgi:hypothetical protein
VTDDRDFSWLGRPAAAPAAVVEHLLWTLTKGVGRAEMRVRVHPLGHELRALVDRGEGLSLLWSQVYRHGDGVDLGALADENKGFWLARGWIEP